MIFKTLTVRSSPHLNAGNSVEGIMWNVVVALMPTVAFAIFLYGISAVLILGLACVSCIASEHLLCRSNGQPSTIGDGSAAITGLLYGLTLPPGLPLWMVLLGGVIAIGLGKFIFGGLGCNPFNPALVARAFLQAAFPSDLTTWTPVLASDRFSHISTSLLAYPFMSSPEDTISAATPLTAFKFDRVNPDLTDLLLGLSSGSLGESCSITLLVGAAYLISRKMMNWRIPAGIFLAVVVMSGLFYLWNSQFYPSPLFMLFSGGLMLGALFMATDMVASPVTGRGCFVYGVLIGVLVLVIRYWAGMAEGMMYAILLANAISPHIDRMLQPRVFGTGRDLT